MASWNQERTPLPGEPGYTGEVNIQEPGAYRDQFSFRGDVEDDISLARRLAQSGGPATREAEQLQKESAAEQMALARGQDGGGQASRMGSEAASQSYVESIAPTAIIAEAEKQGYTREEAGAAGLLAMSDAQFEQQIEQMLAQKERGKVQAEQANKAGLMGTIGSLVGMVSDKEAKENIRPIPEAASEEFLNALQAGKYDYRPEFGGGKDRVGPLLDERIANTEIGQTLVDRDPATQKLRMNTAAAPLVNMALLKQQNDRLQALEQGGGPRIDYNNPAYLGGRAPDYPNKPRYPLIDQTTGLDPRYTGLPPSHLQPLHSSRASSGYSPHVPVEASEPKLAPYAMPQEARLGSEISRGLPARYGGRRAGVAARGRFRPPSDPGTPDRLAELRERHKALKKMEAEQKKDPKSAVLSRFGGSSEAYDQWWNELPKKERPKNWAKALKVLEGGR